MIALLIALIISITPMPTMSTGRLPDCADVVGEKEHNVIGLTDDIHATITICNFSFYERGER